MISSGILVLDSFLNSHSRVNLVKWNPITNTFYILLTAIASARCRRLIEKRNWVTIAIFCGKHRASLEQHDMEAVDSLFTKLFIPIMRDTSCHSCATILFYHLCISLYSANAIQLACKLKILDFNGTRKINRTNIS